MQYRILGRTGLEISALGFGTYATFGQGVDARAARELLARARDAGVNFFDGAETYAAGEAERLLGAAIRTLGWSRDSYLVSSKVFFGASEDPLPTQRGLHRKHVVEACHQALQRLGVEALDFYYCHRPDPRTPVEETLRAMDLLVRQGKILYWGTSEWPAASIHEAYELAREHHLTPPSLEQTRFNLLEPERLRVELAPLRRRHGLGTTTWGPLRAGVLSGKYAGGVAEGTRLSRPGYAQLRESLAAGGALTTALRELSRLADEAGTTLARLAIAWCLKSPLVDCVILGASRPEQLEENLGALAVCEGLDESLLQALERAIRPLAPSAAGGGRLARLPGGARLGRWLRSLR